MSFGAFTYDFANPNSAKSFIGDCQGLMLAPLIKMESQGKPDDQEKEWYKPVPIPTPTGIRWFLALFYKPKSKRLFYACRGTVEFIEKNVNALNIQQLSFEDASALNTTLSFLCGRLKKYIKVHKEINTLSQIAEKLNQAFLTSFGEKSKAHEIAKIKEQQTFVLSNLSPEEQAEKEAQNNPFHNLEEDVATHDCCIECQLGAQVTFHSSLLQSINWFSSRLNGKWKETDLKDSLEVVEKESRETSSLSETETEKDIKISLAQFPESAIKLFRSYLYNGLNLKKVSTAEILWLTAISHYIQWEKAESQLFSVIVRRAFSDEDATLFTTMLAYYEEIHEHWPDFESVLMEKIYTFEEEFIYFKMFTQTERVKLISYVQESMNNNSPIATVMMISFYLFKICESPPDSDIVLQLTEKPCLKDYLPGQFAIAWTYYKKKMNPEKVLEMLEDAAKKEYILACNKLGTFYSRGDDFLSLKKDIPLALSFHQTAANQDSIRAIHCIGFLCINNDKVRAFEMAKKSSDLGCHLGDLELVRFYFEGIVVPKDEIKAAELMKKVSETQDKTIRVMYAYYYLLRGKYVKADVPKAIKIIQETAAKGNFFAQYFFGELLYKGEYLPEDKPESKRLFKIAADQGLFLATQALKVFV